MMDGQKFCLRWESFQSSVTSVFDQLRKDDELTDVVLCSEGGQVAAHRIMLSACSPYFRNLLRHSQHQQVMIFLKDTSMADLNAIIEFMYTGSVNVAQSQLASFIKTAEMLQIRGLSGDDQKVENPASQGTDRSIPHSSALSSAPIPASVPHHSGPSASPHRAPHHSTSSPSSSLTPIPSPSPSPSQSTAYQHHQSKRRRVSYGDEASEHSKSVSEAREDNRWAPPLRGNSVTATAAPEQRQRIGIKEEKLEPTGDDVIDDDLTTFVQPDDVTQSQLDYDSAHGFVAQCEETDVPAEKAVVMETGISDSGASALMQQAVNKTTTANEEGGGFRCAICGNIYKRQYTLRAHEKRHQGLTVCRLCGKVTACMSDLRRHLTHSHGLSKEEARDIAPPLNLTPM